MTTDHQIDAGTKSNLSSRLAHEMKVFFGIFLYLVVAFGFFVLAETLIERETGNNFVATGFAIVNAFVFGKVIMVAEHFRFGQFRRRRHPLAFAILVETLLFTGLLLVFHALEKSASGYIRHGSMWAEFDGLAKGGLLSVFCVIMMLFIVLIPFFAYRNLARELGGERLHTMLFAPREDPGAREK
jgi:hypothetical protein